MRKGFHSLCGIVSSQMALDALSGAVFVFINKKRNQVKLLLWEGDGLSLYYKRLEKGTYERPSSAENTASASLSYQQLRFILQGWPCKKSGIAGAIKKLRELSTSKKNAGLIRGVLQCRGKVKMK